MALFPLKYKATQCCPGSIAKSVLTIKALAYKGFFPTGNSSLAQTCPCNDFIRGQFKMSLSSPVVVIFLIVSNNLSQSVNFDQIVKFCVHDHVHGGGQRFGELKFYSQITRFHRM